MTNQMSFNIAVHGLLTSPNAASALLKASAPVSPLLNDLKHMCESFVQKDWLDRLDILSEIYGLERPPLLISRLKKRFA